MVKEKARKARTSSLARDPALAAAEIVVVLTTKPTPVLFLKA